MRILFLTRKSWPDIGGVEKHIYEVTKILRKKGHVVKIVVEKDIKPPHIKFIGLICIWIWLFKNRKLVTNSDIVHIHDVFIWYLPFALVLSKKKVFTTFHGWEGKYPIPLINIIQKKIASRFSSRTVSVGAYIEKYYGIKADNIIYGA